MNLKNKKRTFIAIAIILLSILLICNTLEVSQAALTQLHVEGRYIKDANGNAIILKGVNAGGFGDTASGWFTTSWSENTVRNNFAAMQSWGINAVRIMGTARWWLENSRENLQGSDVCSISHRDATKRTIEIAQEYGIYVIFTFWSIDTVGPRSPGTQDYLPYPPRASTQNYNTIRSSADFVELWAGNSATSQFLARFRNVDTSGTPSTTSAHVHNNGVAPQSVSEALQNYPNVVYELYNEPSGDNSGWATVTQQVVDAIRARGDNHPIMVQCGYCMSFFGGPNWFDTMYNKMTGRTNIIYSSHIYRSDGSFVGNPYTYSDVYAQMMTTPAPNGFGCGYVLSKNVPILIGEIGNRAWSDQDYTYLESTLRVMNENGISWAAWEWRSGALFTGSFTATRSGQIVRSYANTNPTPPTPPPQPAPLAITASPASTSVATGQSGTFTVTAAGGTAPYTYQWYEGTNPLTGQTSATFTVSKTTAGTYTFYCRVTDSKSATANSNTATLTVTSPAPPPPQPTQLTVTVTPTSKVTETGQSTTFTATVSGGAAPYTYRWYEGTRRLYGQYSAQLTVSRSTAGVYKFYCRVTDAKSTTKNSNTVTLSLTSVPAVPNLSPSPPPTSGSIGTNYKTLENCDSTTGWRAAGGKITLSKADKKQGTASLQFNADGSNWQGYLYRFQSYDLRATPIISFDLKVSRSISVTFVFWSFGKTYTVTVPYTAGQWQTIELDLRKANLDLRISGFELVLGSPYERLPTGTTLQIDNVRVGVPV